MHKMNVLVIAMSLGLYGSAHAEVEFSRHELANGIKLVIVEAPDAQRQTILTFVPTSLADDDQQRAQWSHLLEHMVIRTTDPDALQAPGIEINGETTHAYLRLDTYAEPAQWKAALERHAKWLMARQFDGALLEREKGNIAIEEQTTGAVGATSKFAIAAWNQIVNHGAEHAAVHADVAGAKVEDVQTYADQRLSNIDQVMIATIGPARRDEVKQAVEALVGELKSRPNVSNEKQERAREEGKAKLHGTWDLSTRHLITFWRLPELTPALRAAAFATAGTLQMKLKLQVQNPEHTDIRDVYIYPHVKSSGTQTFIIDCCLTEKGDAQRASEAITQTLNNLGDSATAAPLLKWWLNMQSMQLYPPGAPESLRKQLPESLQHLTEGVWLLSLMNIEWEWRVEFDSIMQAFKAMEEEDCEQLLTRLRDHGQRRELLLEPQKPQ